RQIPDDEPYDRDLGTWELFEEIFRRDIAPTLLLNPAETATLELETRSQSGCARWYDERSKRLTASNFHAICRRFKDRFPWSLLKKLFCNRPHKVIGEGMPAACAYGLSVEKPACELYLREKNESYDYYNMGEKKAQPTFT